ncbi:MAG: chemotaxis protein CheW [Deltaproteobacteria bacterium]|nr:chemotaxis protein CheW [Deltaproteobacteria bacterium]MBW2304424.1 chemotaxis protein CheW [Deltaproteobacteria bacterium]
MHEETQIQTMESQLVAFSLGGQELAFPIVMVQEIVKPSMITRLPNAPDYVEGVANLRGSILPVVNLRHRLGMEVKEQDEETRVVVLNVDGTATGVVVDSVSEVLHVDEKNIEAPPDMVEGIEGQYIQGVAKTSGGKRLTMVLSADKVIPGQDQDSVKRIGTSLDGGTRGNLSDKARQTEDEELLVTFKLAGEEFAVDIMRVQEIVRVGEITKVPKAPAYILGITLLRDRLLPIVDLRVLLGIETLERIPYEGQSEEKAPDGKTLHTDDTEDTRRIVVLDMEGVLTGILVDSVSEVLRLPKSRIEAPPSIIDREQSSKLKGVGKLENGSRLLMLLDADNLISTDQKKVLAAAAGPAVDRRERAGDEERADERQVVCFMIEGEEYGIDIMKVQEIIRIDDITRIPNAPEFVEGVVNLRGSVLPVIDLRGRFGMERTGRADQNRIVVVDISGKTTGIIVDFVSEVLRIQGSMIEPPPEVISDFGLKARYIDGIGKLEEGRRTIVLINADALLAVDESNVMAAVKEAGTLEPESGNPKVDVGSKKTSKRTASRKSASGKKPLNTEKKTNGKAGNTTKKRNTSKSSK